MRVARSRVAPNEAMYAARLEEEVLAQAEEEEFEEEV